MKKRCEWVKSSDPLYIEYHDIEWGRPVRNDRLLFEGVVLEGFVAGLSWYLILKKRAHFRKVFDEFDAEKMVGYNEKKITELLHDPGIVRNKLKVRAAVINAGAYLKVKEEFGSFEKYIWQFTNYQQIDNALQSVKEASTRSPESDAMSKDMIKRGFKFCGSTTMYAFMQAVGMVNDHTTDCFCYEACKE